MRECPHVAARWEMMPQLTLFARPCLCERVCVYVCACVYLLCALYVKACVCVCLCLRLDDGQNLFVSVCVYLSVPV